MEVRFSDRKLQRLEHDREYTLGFAREVVKAFRKRIQFIRSAADDRDFYGMSSLRFEKLRGQRRHQCSMRLNKQWRLILEFENDGDSKVVVVVSIEDYH